jgi:hypothetical protein
MRSATDAKRGIADIVRGGTAWAEIDMYLLSRAVVARVHEGGAGIVDRALNVNQARPSRYPVFRSPRRHAFETNLSRTVHAVVRVGL